jgi:predicted transcriptional regulator
LLIEPTERLRAFLRDHVSSYEALEVLLLLARDAQRPRNEADLAAKMNVAVEAISQALDGLHQSGLLELSQVSGSTSYRYAPHSELLSDSVDELRRVYAEHPLAIVQIMTANALDRMRSSAARRLADAFRLERPKK